MKHTVTEHRLASGAKGLIVDVPGSSVVNILVRFNSGFQFGDFDHFEIPHVIEHMIAVGGTKKFPQPNEFAHEIEKNGATFNANTSGRYNGYYLTCANFELDRIMDLLSQWLAEPLLPAENFVTEISNVREELTRSTTQHSSVCSMALLEKTFPKEYLNYDSRLAQLENITHQMCVDHYRRTHTAKNARFYLSGAIEANQGLILEKLEKLFDALPSGKRFVPNFDPGTGVGSPIINQRDIKQLYYYFDIFNGSVDDRMDFALRRLGSVLFGGWKSRVFGEARTRGLAYGISGSGQGDRWNSSFGVWGFVTEDNVSKLMKLVARELKAVAAGDLKPAELDAAIERTIGRRAIAHQTAGALGNYYLDLYDTEERIRPYDGELAQIRATTVAEVTAAAEFMLSSDRWAISWLGDLDETKAAIYTEPLRRMFNS